MKFRDFPNNLPEKWNYFFSFREHINQSMIVGAWGGKYLPDTKDRIWQPFFANYLAEKDIRDTIYWNLHPDGGGLLSAGWVIANPEKGELLDIIQPDPTDVSFDDESGETQYMYTANKATYFASMLPDKPSLKTKEEEKPPKKSNLTEVLEQSTKDSTLNTKQTQQEQATQNLQGQNAETFPPEDLFGDFNFDFMDNNDWETQDVDSLMMGLSYDSEAVQVLSEIVEGIVYLEKQKLKYQYMLQLQRLQLQASMLMGQEDNEVKSEVEKQMEVIDFSKPVSSSFRRPRNRFNYETLVEF